MSRHIYVYENGSRPETTDRHPNWLSCRSPHDSLNSCLGRLLHTLGIRSQVCLTWLAQKKLRPNQKRPDLVE